VVTSSIAPPGEDEMRISIISESQRKAAKVVGLTYLPSGTALTADAVTHPV